MFLNASELSADVLARASVILSVLVLLLFSSLTSVYIIIRNKNLNDATNFYLISLLMADFLWASIIVPMSVYSSLMPNWNFMGDNSLVCKSSAYLQIVIMTSTMYTFSWLSVDRYSAFMKPSRYESEHTLTRCKCWIAFTWMTALLVALPIAAKMEANYYHDYEFCVLNWSSATAYSITLAVLVLVPSLCTIIFTTIAIFLAMRKPDELEDVQRLVLTDHNFVVTLFVIISFFLAWFPIIIVHFIPESLVSPADIATMKFSFIWMAIGCSSMKILIFLFINREFRQYFCIPCLGQDNDTFNVVSASDENFSGTVHKSGILARLCCFCCQHKPAQRDPVVHRQHYARSDNVNVNPPPLRSYRSEFNFPETRNASNASYNYYNGGSNSMIGMQKPFVGARYQAGYGSVSTQFPPGF